MRLLSGLGGPRAAVCRGGASIEKLQFVVDYYGCLNGEQHARGERRSRVCTISAGTIPDGCRQGHVLARPWRGVDDPFDSARKAGKDLRAPRGQTVRAAPGMSRDWQE